MQNAFAGSLFRRTDQDAPLGGLYLIEDCAEKFGQLSCRLGKVGWIKFGEEAELLFNRGQCLVGDVHDSIIADLSLTTEDPPPGRDLRPRGLQPSGLRHVRSHL